MFARDSRAAHDGAPTSPGLDVEAPAAWSPVPMDAPDLSQAPQVRLVEWRSWAAADDRARRLVVGCFAAETSVWAPDASGLALDKVGEIASSTEARVATAVTLVKGATVQDGPSLRRPLEGPPTSGAHAQSFLGYTAAPPAMMGCFVLCTGDLDGTCRSILESARLRGALLPFPGPGRPLRAVLFMVHHPQYALGLGVALFGLALAGGVATRRRPRSRRRLRPPGAGKPC